MEVILQEFELVALERRGYVVRFVQGLDAEQFGMRIEFAKVGALTLLTAELLAEEFGVSAEVIDPAELFPGDRLLFWGERYGRDRFGEFEVVRVP